MADKVKVTSTKTKVSGHLKGCLVNNLLVTLTVIGVVIGIIVGVSVRQSEPSQDVVIWIGLPGEVYMRMLKMMILPLIICSVITGTASLDPKCNGRISIISLTYIIVSNSLACIVPMIIAILLKPDVQTSNITQSGQGMNLQVLGIQRQNTVVMDTQDIFADLIRNLFPENIITACFQQTQTTYTFNDIVLLQNQSTGNGSDMTWDLKNTTIYKRIKGVGTVSSTNVLGLVLCCLIFGMATASIGSSGKPFLQFFNSANEIIMKVLRWFVWFTPLGVASLIAVAFLKTKDLDSAVFSLGKFSLCVLGSLALHQLVLVPIVYYLLVRQNPYRFLLTLGRPWVVSFAAASSAVAIPETLTSLENDNKIDKRITRFVVPFATTINRDGSCIFIVISCLFVSQMIGVDLHIGRLVLMWVLTTVISVAIPSVPSAGVVAVVINLTALGIPADFVGLLFATEWVLDRFRSAANMLSHAHCSMITFRFCKNYLPPSELATENHFVMEVAEPMLKE